MKEELKRFLIEFFASSELNRLHENYGGGRIFSDPLIGVASGDDPIYQKYKEVVGPEHYTPLEFWLAWGKKPFLLQSCVSFPSYFHSLLRSAKRVKIL